MRGKNNSGFSVGKGILSLFGTGFFPFAPGTMGSAFSLVILLFLERALPVSELMRASLLIMFFLIILLLGTHLAKTETSQKNHDASWIVLDEFLGMFISALPLFFMNGFLPWTGLSFLSFRLFDILKPFGIRKIDEQGTPFSVFADDIIAGIYALVLTMIIYSLFHA